METEDERVIIVTRRVTAASREASRRNGAKSAEIMQSEEHRAKLRAAQVARRERERQEKDALGLPIVEKKANGRPKKEPAVVEGPPRRPGRPRKQNTGDATA